MKTVLALCGCALLLLGAATSASADVKVRKKMVFANGAGGIEMTEYVKGKRTRTETNAGGMVMITLQQCDLGRTVQINEKTKKYFVVSGSMGAAAPAAGAAPSKKGGIVTVTSTLTDTGERKQVFGMTARHIKTKIVQEPGPGACDPTKSSFETDGWYVDLDGYGDGCASAGMGGFGGGMGGGCQDEIRSKTIGTAKLGYPISFTIQTQGDGASTTIEAIEVSQATLDPALFEIPAGYTQVNSFVELMSP